MKLISTKICKTSDIGVNDNLFGGTMLAWLDEAGGIMASSVCCSSNLVTLKIEEVLFKEPVKVKQQIRIYGKVAFQAFNQVRYLLCFCAGNPNRRFHITPP
jgi:acyl-CoA thioesterase YciA